MKKPEILAARDLNSRADRHLTVTIPDNTGNPVLDANLYDLAQRFNGGHNLGVVLQMLSTVMNAADSEQMEEHDLEMMARTVDEMFAADKMFAPYRNVRKITCFGSARIQPEEDAYKQAVDFSRMAVEKGYMVITGGGPGIMQACNEGATKDASFGLNITLPYEQHANPYIAGNEKMMNFYYFYTRKLNFLKQTDALVAFPGGFGTMDEIFETITLIQTGKSTIFPVVLLDPPGETFWLRWMRFIEKELLDAGLISRTDMHLLYRSKSAEDAMAYIERFYRRYHSYYFESDSITIRILEPLTQKHIDWILHDYTDIMPKGDLVQLQDDANDPEPALACLPRLRFTLKRGDYARLKDLIDIIND
ncbi:MAG: TIGR00730 family Rossman fold protein [Akkermansia sp.]|nr:TIGR00730 family Rossman fold protein [Akkermansia sp.]